MSRSIGSLSRRDLFRLAAAGVAGWSASGWIEALAADAARSPQRKRSCILLWMNGGPSQTDTFDLKPGTANGGPFKEISTSVPGIKISEHLPRVARQAHRMAIVRSMKTKEADHVRGTYLMRTGRAPGGPIQYPVLGSFISKELERPELELPGFISVGNNFFFGNSPSGFLGPQYAPLVVGQNFGRGPGQGGDGIDAALKVQDLAMPADISSNRAAARVGLLQEMEEDFVAARPDETAQSHHTAYKKAVTLMRSAAARAFDLSDEPAALRDRYGRNLFGQACLLARRLVERDVPFIEVSFTNGNWDTHNDNFEQVKRMSGVLDPAWATLMEDLEARGLLDTTLIVWMGEFGRTPRINGNKGRDHWATSWSTVLAGGGIKGGQVVGKTSADGMEVIERPVATPDLLATVCLALGLDPKTQNRSNVGRPIRLTDPTASPIKEIIA